MNSVILMDVDRLRAIGAPYSFFRKEDGKLECLVVEDYAFKFIVLLDQTLVIGPIRDHKALYGVYEAMALDPEQARCKVRELENECFSWFDCPIIAAGMVSSDGRVTDWESGGFRVITPAEMRAEIEQEIQRLFESGELQVE